MGWCSATETFDAVTGFILEADMPIEQKTGVIRILIETLEQNEWDCQGDSMYYTDPIVKAIFKDMHPNWYKWEDETE